MESTTTKSVTTTTSDGIVLVKIDMPGSSANVLTVDLFVELESTFSELQDRNDLQGLVLYSAKPSIFVAGADLKRIVSTLNWPDEEIIKFCEQGRAVMSRLNRMPFTTVAAIHGACVGGGLEIALWCDRRLATNDRKTILGLPEVKLGLVPGWAGTVRLPRIAAFEPAIDLVTSGRVVKAEQAKEIGFVDQVVESPEDLVEQAVAFIKAESFETVKADRDALRGPVADAGDSEQLKSKFEQEISDNSAIYPFACNIALDHMLSSGKLPEPQACHSESLAMASVYGSEPSYGLLNNFFLGEHNKKQPGFVDLKLSQRAITTVGIVGAGLMGSSIASICLKAGCEVILLDADPKIAANVAQELAAKQKPDGPSCQAGDDYAQFADCDLVIESVVEVADVKKSVLERVCQAVSDQAIIATNTSAVPLAKLVSAVDKPERFCGLHFCHPELMQLVEVVKSNLSGEEVIADVTNWVRRLRKMPVVVKDGPGFVVNRLLAAMLDQAFRLYSKGVSIAKIDEAMREFGFQAGPFEIVDIIGADTCMYAGREMYEGGVQCVNLTPILPRLVKKNWFGRKAGQGFYRYESTTGKPDWNPEVDELLASYVESVGTEEVDSKIDNQFIADSICSCIVLEASRILTDGIVNDARDIDLCIINGFSFPAHTGGILFWADRKTIEFVNDVLEELSSDEGKLKTSDVMAAMQRDSESFYPSQAVSSAT